MDSKISKTVESKHLKFFFFFNNFWHLHTVLDPYQKFRWKNRTFPTFYWDREQSKK